MSTLLVLTDSLAPTDGVGQLARGHLRAWSELVPELRFDVRLARDHAPHEAEIELRYRPRANLPPRAWAGAGGLRAAWLLRRARRTLEPFRGEAPCGIVCWKEDPFAELARAWAAELRVPFVFFAHGTYAVRALRDLRARARALAAYAEARACFAVSDLVAEKLRAEAELGSLQVLPNGIDLAPYAPYAPGDMQVVTAPPCGGAPFALTLAAAKERKGLHLATNAWRAFAATHADWHWVIVGDSHLREAYGAELARELALVPRVHRVDRVDEATKRAWLQWARLHLFTPVEARDGAFEGFGLPFLEAAACGTFSIGTRSCGAARHVEPDLAEFAEPQPDAVLAAWERELGRSEAERRSRARRARELLPAHDLRQRASRVLEVLGMRTTSPVGRGGA